MIRLRSFVFFLFFFLPFYLFTFLPSPVNAQNYELLPAGTVIDSDYIQGGNIVQIDGEIKGDAFLTGGLVTINGKIDGDLFVAGGKVNVNGEVGNSVRLLGGDVTLNGPVGRNVLLDCGNCTVTHQASVSGSFLTAGGNLDVLAPSIGRGFRFFGNRLYLNSIIGRETFVVANQEFILGPAASVSGDLKYTGNAEAVVQTGATVSGKIAYEKTNPEQSFPRFFGAQSVFSAYQHVKPVTDLLGFFVSALIGFVLLGLFPKIFEKTVNAIDNRPTASLGWGVIIALGTPVVVVLFAITVIGLPIALVLILTAYIIWLLATYLSAFYIGRRILLSRFGERRGWALVLGLFLFYLLGFVPIIGTLVRLVLVLFAVGAVVLSYKQPAIFEQRPIPFEYSVTNLRKRPSSRPRKR